MKKSNSILKYIAVAALAIGSIGAHATPINITTATPQVNWENWNIDNAPVAAVVGGSGASPSDSVYGFSSSIIYPNTFSPFSITYTIATGIGIDSLRIQTLDQLAQYNGWGALNGVASVNGGSAQTLFTTSYDVASYLSSALLNGGTSTGVSAYEYDPANGSGLSAPVAGNFGLLNAPYSYLNFSTDGSISLDPTQSNTVTFTINGYGWGSTGVALTHDGNYALNLLNGTGGWQSMIITGQVVPEPTTWAMLLGGLGMLTMFRRRRA
jgi:hypothetical protein